MIFVASKFELRKVKKLGRAFFTMISGASGLELTSIWNELRHAKHHGSSAGEENE